MNVKLALVGDLFPANLNYQDGFGVASQFAQNNCAYWIENLKPYFTEADISLANLESPLIVKEKKPQDKCFAGSTEFASMLRQSGINMVTIANNHILEHGIEGVLSTKEALKKNDIKYVGDFFDGISNIETFEANGIKVGIAGFNDENNIENKNIYAEYSEQNVIKTLDLMSSLEVNYKIIILHWGDEYIHIPSIQQIRDAHKFIDRGADIIVGHHPHVIQPVERYKKGLIFYSLGNFIFDMRWSNYVRLGMLANVTLEKDKGVKYDTTLLYIDNDFIPRRVNNCRLHQNLIKKTEKRMGVFYSLLDSTLSESDYDKYYKRHIVSNKNYQRILRKIFLIKNWNKVSHKSKRLLFSKILSRLKFKKGSTVAYE